MLSAIIAETPNSHPDKESLKRAKDQMEHIIREVNEQTYRQEVVQESLNPKLRWDKGDRKGLERACFRVYRTDQETSSRSGDRGGRPGRRDGAGVEEGRSTHQKNGPRGDRVGLEGEGGNRVVARLGD